ncbi:hypothetical protein CAI21_10570 [Alkalilimnicola ehrlichii]|uniref:Uncharacterized protein n=1 Tax=Alkalilimnicola ehrlichii TaxID=351052 RepID=A0A3E0WVT8_9GAMM|nr:hypothetical protein [Alkalilimnicola ehrlichii]RFA29204.1 hypothetical protein CAI21_10570 [Alkalilimnicola ehrlichii]RFA36115.1 hypothetical protein CAL65_11710 [Alkalilimnicola ehrlichii]
MEGGSIASNYLNQFFDVFKQGTAQTQQRMMKQVADRQAQAADSMQTNIEMMRARVQAGQIDLYA